MAASSAISPAVARLKEPSPNMVPRAMKTVVARPLKGIHGKVCAAAQNKKLEERNVRETAVKERKVAKENVQATDTIVDVEDEVLAAPLDADALNHGVSCVKMKLATFVPDANIRKLINCVVRDLNIVLAEAYAFANLHVTRALEMGDKVTDVGPKFYDRCIKSVAKCAVQGKKLEPSFLATKAIFDGLRPEANAAIDITLLNDIKSELVISMGTMAANHLRTNMKQRLENWISWRYHKFTKQIRTAIVMCVAVTPKAKFEDVKGLATKDAKGKECSEAKKRSVAEAVSLIKELRSLAPLTSEASKLGIDKVASLVPLYHRIMKETESAFAAARDDVAMMSEDDALRRPAVKLFKRLRRARFSMLPYKHGYTTSHVPICSRAWIGLLRRVKRSNGVAYVPIKTNRPNDNVVNSAWRRHCNVNLVESKTRAFGWRIATDGCAVTVVMEATRARVLPEANGEWDPRIIQKLTWDESLLQWVGVDPGLTDVVTVFNEQTGRTTSYSSSRYYEDAKIKVSNRRTNKWNRDTASEALRVDSSGNASSSSAPFYGSYLREIRGLLAHRMERGYRNMRFMRYVFKQKAISAICDMISPTDRFTVVAFGDWAGPGKSPISRRHCGPLQEIKRELRSRKETTFLRSVWECRTSMVCSATKTVLRNMVADTTKVDRRTGARKTSERVRVHKILHCQSSAVDVRRHGGTWNRDANAARNILMLLKLEVRGEARPAEFMPATRPRGGTLPRGKAVARQPTTRTVIPGLPKLGGNIQ
jgi:hypothetical protein